MKLPVRLLTWIAALALHLDVSAQPANQAPIPFPGLRTHVIQGSTGRTLQQISYLPALTRMMNDTFQPEFNTQGIGGVDMTRVLVTRVNRALPARHYVYFDPGASGDPAFVLVEEATRTPIGTIDADHLVIPGNGFIYSIGRTNNRHLERRKFEISDGKLKEVEQPFLYVGLETKANVPIMLTRTKDGTDSVASVPKGDRLFVVLSDGEHLLIRTSFGLVGWFKTSASRDSPDIEGIYFDGD